MFITTDTIHIWLALFLLSPPTTMFIGPLPCIWAVNVLSAHLPSSTFKSILTGYKWISIIYTNVGYARSRQLPATVHRNEKVIEKCHRNSALRKEKGHLKKWIKSGQGLQREWNIQGTKRFLCKTNGAALLRVRCSADQLSHDICTPLIRFKIVSSDRDYLVLALDFWKCKISEW